MNKPLSGELKIIVRFCRLLVLRTLQIYLIILIPILHVVVVVIRVLKKTPADFKQRRVVLGGAGLINHAKWCGALRDLDVDAKTFVWGTPKIYDCGTFDYDMQAKWGDYVYLVAPWIFLKTIFCADTVICGFDGFLLGVTNLRRFELKLMKLAKCKVVVAPYGADSFVYRNIDSKATAHVLQISYPQASRNQNKIESDVRRNVKNADFLFLGFMSLDGFGRWDALSVSPLVIDIDIWRPKRDKPKSQKLTIVHTPNHRGFKGTEFLIQAVKELQNENHDIELMLLEGIPNSEVMKIFIDRADVLVEQLIAPGYALSAIEGMATGLIVISNLSDQGIIAPMRRWSYLDECPIVSATPETIKEVLVKLIERPKLREELSKLSRMYAEKYHSYQTFQEFYEAIDCYLYEQGPDLINFYHPIIGTSSTVEKKIKTPLVSNEII
jgi:glycosyltransferase involved in cell wall biosynthesis